MRHSKVQKQVLALYKECLRAAKSKPGFEATVKQEFRKNAVAVQRSDTLRIEFLMRSARKKLTIINDPNVSGMGHFVNQEEPSKK